MIIVYLRGTFYVSFFFFVMMMIIQWHSGSFLLEMCKICWGDLGSTFYVNFSSILLLIRAFFSVPIQIGTRQIALAQNYITFSEPKIFINTNFLQLFNSKCLIVPQCWGPYIVKIQKMVCARGRKFQGLLTQQSLCVIADDQTTNPAVCLEEIIPFIKIQPKSQISNAFLCSTPPVNLKCNRIAFKSSWLKLLIRAIITSHLV